MSTTVERPRPRQDERHPEPSVRPARRNRMLPIAVAAIGLVAIGLGITLYASTTDDGATDVPSGVDEFVDAYVATMESNDYEGLEALVTSGFRRAFYQGDADGSPWRDVWRITAFEFWEDPKAPLVDWEIERLGDPIVRGDDPWYLSEVQIWKNRSVGIQYEGISTMVIVDDGTGTLKVDDAYWASHPANMDG